MAFMERIERPDTDGERVVIRLLRHYRGLHDRDGDGGTLASLVALGQNLRLPPAGSVALASVFQLTEALLRRRLITECCCSCDYSADERAVIRLLGARLPCIAGTGSVEIPHGLPGALAWAILSVRSLCGAILVVPSHPLQIDDPACPFDRPFGA
ncbi:hypothetical protein [Sphingomonas sp. Leaf4]|uniref:hypothetical protein n=1 Tax=Sphingomonas sp. Leaf4 TaxID=2876553 RepID=UPI001E3E7956|nr:hypothetical protein [Sphingomonas sp. Leaf4]